MNIQKKTLYEDFISNVKRQPNATALIDGITGEKISYESLYKKALKIATILVNKDIEKGECIGIVLPRSCNQIYAILGILFAGAVYVPIGKNQPKNRRREICEQIGIKSIITDSNTINELELNGENISLINIDNIDSVEGALEYPIKIKAKESCYIIMTSGSTGIPKGVELCHENVVNTIVDINNKYNVNNLDTAIMVSAIDFDLSVYDIFGLLSAGGKIVVLDEINFKDPSLWIELIDKFKVTIWNTVPILFEMLVTMIEEADKNLSLRVVMLSGDWINVNLPQRFYKINNKSTVVAMGGATEAAIWSNYFNIPKENLKEVQRIPYGKPLKNQVYRVIDDFGRICPNYVNGELLIGGAGVAKGYKCDIEMTKEKFFFDEVKWYKTGDYGRIWDDGTIEFLGRKDGQVKIKGFRIELGEIEMAIKKLDSVLESYVGVISNSEFSKVVAYVVESNKNQVDESEIKNHLRKFIPDYMIPTLYYITTERIELNNGKLDKKKIDAILSEKLLNLRESTDYIKPNTEIEKEISEIWEIVFKKKKISIKDNFFELGGDSLKAVSMINKIKAYYNLMNEISIGAIFKFPTIKLLALEIERLKNGVIEGEI